MKQMSLLSRMISSVDLFAYFAATPLFASDKAEPGQALSTRISYPRLMAAGVVLAFLYWSTPVFANTEFKAYTRVTLRGATYFTVLPGQRVRSVIFIEEGMNKKRVLRCGGCLNTCSIGRDWAWKEPQQSTVTIRDYGEAYPAVLLSLVNLETGKTLNLETCQTR